MKEQETDVKQQGIPDPDKPLLSDKHGRSNLRILTFNRQTHVLEAEPFLKAFFSGCLEMTPNEELV